MMQILYPILAILSLLPFVSSGAALFVGMATALTFGNPYSKLTQNWTSRLLQLSIIGLGAGMNLNVVLKTGAEGIITTSIGISLTLLLGIGLAKLLKTEKNSALLITVGTAICGGSAIAAVAPAIKAKPHEISVALATVFFLNATALFIFPYVGHSFHLTQHQFGLFSALAIHDTSSVVGAALQYGPEALDVATTLKLARALWIIPVSLGIGFLWKQTSTNPKTNSKTNSKKPWFILGFLLMAAAVTWLPALQPVGYWVNFAAKRTLVLTLFLIGSGLTRSTLLAVGLRPLALGVTLWALVSVSTLVLLLQGWL